MAKVQTKICGITRAVDATVAYDAGADAIGLNFYSRSKRFVDRKTAGPIAKSVDGKLAVFGVFVNSSVAEIETICEAAPLTHVQFHGDETPAIVSDLRTALPNIKTVRALRIMDDDLKSAQKEIDEWQEVGVDMVLLDAASLDAFGGTGKTLNWKKLKQLSFNVPWLLAGGLGPANVAEAITLSEAVGVDVASGVEAEPGIKDPKLIQDFVSTAKNELTKG